MNDLKDHQPVRKEDITISVHMVNGELHTQTIPFADIEVVQEFMAWYRKPGRSKTWEWHCIVERAIHLFRHDHIIAVDIEGYIELDGRPSRWYEKLIDRIRAWRYV